MKNIIQPDRFKEITSQFMSIEPLLVVGDIGVDELD